MKGRDAHLSWIGLAVYIFAGVIWTSIRWGWPFWGELFCSLSVSLLRWDRFCTGETPMLLADAPAGHDHGGMDF